MIVFIQISHLDLAKLTCHVMRRRRIKGELPEADPLIVHVWFCVLLPWQQVEIY